MPIRRHNSIRHRVKARPDPRVLLWIVRLLVHGRKHDVFGALLGVLDENLLDSLGIQLEEDEEGWLTPEETDEALTRLLARLESSADAHRRTHLEKNIEVVGARLGLTKEESEVLRFLCVICQVSELGNLFANVRSALSTDSIQCLSFALEIAESKVRTALSPKGTLTRSGIVQYEPRAGLSSHGIEYEMLDGLALELVGQQEAPDSLFRNFFRNAPEAVVNPADVSHWSDEIDLMAVLLKRSSSEGVRGVNILLHGPPGTGKTQLARYLASHAGLQGYEVTHEDARGEPHLPGSRQRSYQLCQHLMERNRNALIIFDEIEDAFEPRGRFSPRRIIREGRHGGKAWTNHLLEHNPVPAIWITNHPEQLDPAYLRRFVHVMDVRVPPRSVRRRMLSEACNHLGVSDSWLDRMSELEGLTPAEIRSAVRVGTLVKGELEDSALENFLEKGIERRGRLYGGRIPTPRRRGADLLEYSLDVLNADVSLPSLVESLARSGEGSLLLHGLPGTGKTAFANYIADQMDRPLMLRPASDILSPWLGMTEQNIAAMFREAADENAVLLLDEADSLLSNRESARARWEVTQTNELLVQIERFPGVLICATNLLRSLDSAAMRRFDFKVALHPLDSQQRLLMLGRLLHGLGVDSASESIKEQMDSLDNLTLGDFGVVARRYAKHNEETPTVEQIISDLALECRMKPGGEERKAGFF